MEEHKKCMLNQPPCGHSPTILEQMGRPKLEREDQGVVFSPSSISGCHRRHSLQKEHDWFIDPDQAYSQIRGNLVHAGMEKEPAPEGSVGVIRELRLHAPIQTKYGQQRFSGQIDEALLVRIEDGTLHVALTDWKTRSDVPHTLLEAEDRHVYQINDYRWLTESVLAEYLNNWDTMGPAEAKLYLNQELPPIDRVVVDEINIVYLSMTKTRRFSSDQFFYTKGKLLGEKDANNKWHAYVPHEYDTIELSPLRMFKFDYTESIIRHGIEVQIEAEKNLAAPLTDEDARRMCPSCGVREVCIQLGEAQGYDMYAQKRKG